MIVDNPQKSGRKIRQQKNDEMAGFKKFVLHRWKGRSDLTLSTKSDIIESLYMVPCAI